MYEKYDKEKPKSEARLLSMREEGATGRNKNTEISIFLFFNCERFTPYNKLSGQVVEGLILDMLRT